MEKHISITKENTETWRGEIRLGSDKAKFTTSYTDDFEGWEDRVPYLGSAFPDYSGAILVAILPNRQAGNLIEVTLEYESSGKGAKKPGRPPGEEGPIKRYSGRPSLESVSILAAPRYKDLEKIEQIAIQQIINGEVDKDDGTAWEDDVTSLLGTECLKKVRKGITDFREPGFQWIEKMTSENLVDFELSKIGKIDTPPGDAPQGGNRNYMRLPGSLDQTEDGTAWDMERAWEMSGENGWDEDLYGPAA